MLYNIFTRVSSTKIGNWRVAQYCHNKKTATNICNLIAYWDYNIISVLCFWWSWKFDLKFKNNVPPLLSGIFIFKEGDRPPFTLICSCSWAQGLCEDQISKVKEQASNLIKTGLRLRTQDVGTWNQRSGVFHRLNLN